MFGYRSDGKKVKNLNIIDKAGPFFMPQRIDAVNLIKVKVPCQPIDDFIAKERKNGNHYTYMHIIFATLVRVLYTRKRMNWFIMRGSIYERNYISLSMDIKSKLSDEGSDITSKFYFTGKESLAEIKEIVDKQIEKDLTEEDATTKTAGKLVKLPDFMFRWFMALVRWMDKHGLLPKSLIKASPFHTSGFITYLKSIKLSYIYHHLYNFGTTSMFVSVGKEKVEPVVENNKEIKLKKMLTLGMTLDERIADGFYMGKSLKLCKDLLENPDSLLVGMPDDGTIPKKLLRKNKKSAKKASKKAKKSARKTGSKPKKIKPLKNKIKLDKRLKKHHTENIE